MGVEVLVMVKVLYLHSLLLRRFPSQERKEEKMVKTRVPTPEKKNHLFVCVRISVIQENVSHG